MAVKPVAAYIGILLHIQHVLNLQSAVVVESEPAPYGTLTESQILVCVPRQSRLQQHCGRGNSVLTRLLHSGIHERQDAPTHVSVKPTAVLSFMFDIALCCYTPTVYHA